LIEMLLFSSYSICSEITNGFLCHRSDSQCISPEVIERKNKKRDYLFIESIRRETCIGFRSRLKVSKI
jgi:hypothetical protein